MFNIGDKISHPMHGAGIIEDIVYRRVDDQQVPFYLANMLFTSMTVMIPCNSCEAIGIREVVSKDEAERLIAAIPRFHYDFNENWSKRYRENIDMIKSGDLVEVSKVIKALILRERERGISTGERKLLNTAKGILFSELVLALDKSSAEINNIINESIV